MRREDQLQKAVASLLDHSGLAWQHSPNEGLRTPRQGAHAKSMGLKPGFPDVAIYDPFPGFAGLAIELKAPDEKGKRPKPTDSQLAWLNKLDACGWRTAVCYSVDEVLALVRQCYPGRVK